MVNAEGYGAEAPRLALANSRFPSGDRKGTGGCGELSSIRSARSCSRCWFDRLFERTPEGAPHHWRWDTLQFRQQESAELELEAAAGEELEAAETEEMPDAVPAEAASEMPDAEPAEAASEMPEDGHSKNTVVGGGELSHIDLGAQVRPGMGRGGIFRGCRWGTTRDDAGKVIVSQAIQNILFRKHRSGYVQLGTEIMQPPSPRAAPGGLCYTLARLAYYSLPACLHP